MPSILPPSVVATARHEPWWTQRHKAKVEQIQHSSAPIDILFLGDSIIHEWEDQGSAAQAKYLFDYQIVNLGFGGDCTEHLLWRLQQIKQRTQNALNNRSVNNIVLQIGTNNAGHRNDPATDIYQGILAIVNELQTMLPNTHIILMALFPRSKNPQKRLRIKVDETNALLANYARKTPPAGNITYLDINKEFLTPEGILLESVMPDLLHPNAEQYHVWAKALLNVLV